jgi:hypothetical protein
MPAGDIQRLEVVVVGLDLRGLRDLEAHAAQDLDAFVDGLRDRMQRSDRGRPTRQRDVDALALQRLGELALAHDGLAFRERLLERALDEVGGAADRAAFLGRQPAHASQQVGQGAFPTQVGDAPVLQRACAGGAVQLGHGGRLQLVQALPPVGTRARICVCHDRCLLRERAS